MPTRATTLNPAQKIRIQKMQIGGAIAWHNVTDPDPSVLKQLKALYPFLMDEDLQDCMPPFQRPKLLRREQYLFLVLLFPVLDDRTGTFMPYEVDFFIGRDFVVTSHRGTHPEVTSLGEARASDEGTCTVHPCDTSLHLALDIIHGLTVACFPMITGISNELIGVERRLFDEDEADGDITRQLLRIRTSVVGFRKSMQGSDNVLRKLLVKGTDLFEVDGYRAQIEDINTHSREVRDFLENDRDTVAALYDAHLSQATFRSAEATKTLTAMAGIVLPMTLVAAIFTMHAENIPFSGRPDDFWLMLGCIAGTMIALAMIMRYKKWL